MIFTVSASYLYYENPENGLSGRREYTMSIVYECDSGLSAIVAGIKWGLNRGQANEFGKPVCIKVHPYSIGKPDENGYIRTGIVGILPLLEWKYDTSPFTVEDLLQHYSEQKETPHVG